MNYGAAAVALFPVESALPDVDVAIDEARRTLFEMVVTELDLGLTFLDVAATTTDSKHARRSVDHAIAALRAADKFWSELSPATGNLDELRQRRERLAVRLQKLRAPVR